MVLLFDKSLEGFMMPVFVFYFSVSRDLYFLSFRMPDRGTFVSMQMHSGKVMPTLFVSSHRGRKVYDTPSELHVQVRLLLSGEKAHMVSAYARYFPHKCALKYAK